MLSGIRTGKKKKQKKSKTNNQSQLQSPQPVDGVTLNNAASAGRDKGCEEATATATPTAAGKTTTTGTSSNQNQNNLSIAAKLKAALAATGGDGEKKREEALLQIQEEFSTSAAGTSNNNNKNQTPLEELEKRGRVVVSTASASASAQGQQQEQQTIIVDTNNFKKVNKREEDMSIHELAVAERQSKMNVMSWDEEMTRNLARVGKRKFSTKVGIQDDSDEEIERLQRLLPGDDGGDGSGKKKKKKSDNDIEKAKQRNIQQQINQYQQQDKVTSKCSWWIESSSFSRHRLLSLGDNVSLVMAPPSQSLPPMDNDSKNDDGGGGGGNQNHFYMVPLKHSKSFVDCYDDNNTWDEVDRFFTSLNKMYAKQGKAILLMETVMPNRGFWQTKIEAIPVPFAILQDTPIFYKSAMTEQLEELGGTHNKILKNKSRKPCWKNILPKNFPYFAIYWGNVTTSDSTGYAQIIESTEFRHDFGIDTLAGMLELDPIRFQRKKKFSSVEERTSISKFLSNWKSVDWTIELDQKQQGQSK